MTTRTRGEKEILTEKMFSRFRKGNSIFGHRFTTKGCTAYCGVDVEQLEHVLDYMLKNTESARHAEIINAILRLQSSPGVKGVNLGIAKEAADTLFAVHVREKIVSIIEESGGSEDKQQFVFETLQYFETLEEQQKWFSLTVKPVSET